MGIMEKKMEATIMGYVGGVQDLGFRVLGFRVQGLGSGFRVQG